MFPTSSLLTNLVSQPFKRAQLGLFHGKTKQTGNNVPFSKHKTRRTWLPNVHNKRFFSDVLEDFVRVKVSTKALKTIKKVRLFVCSSRRKHSHKHLSWDPAKSASVFENSKLTGRYDVTAWRY